MASMQFTKAFATAAASFFRPAAAAITPSSYITIMHRSKSSSSVDERFGSPIITVGELLQRALVVRREICQDDDGSAIPSFIFDSTQLAYHRSSYDMNLLDDDRRISINNRSVKRGFCNWLIPQRIMIGQYPGKTPEINGPSSMECRIHIQNMVQDAKINMFCCLQTEVPPQDDDFRWGGGGEIYLEPMSLRREFPRPFTRYGPVAQKFSTSSAPLVFCHSPIEDLSTPSCDGNLLLLLSTLLHHLESDANNTLYLHCWGGRGRAGLIGGLLVSLLFPELSSQQVLQFVQDGYDTRQGSKLMHSGLRKSPQTEQQREFVREFVTLVKDVSKKERKTEYNS